MNRLRCWWSHISGSDKIAGKLHAHARGSKETRRVRRVFSPSFCPLLKLQTASSQIARCLNVSLCHCFVLRIFEAAAKRMRGKLKQMLKAKSAFM